MTEYDNNNTGVIFNNRRKSAAEHPDGTGNCTLDGVEYWLDCWDKKSQAGEPYKSISVKAKEGDSGNENTGAIFRNKNRKTDKHPHGQGQLTVDGTEYWVSMWSKVSKKGMDFKSLSFRPKDAAQVNQKEEQKPDSQYEADEIPFLDPPRRRKAL